MIKQLLQQAIKAHQQQQSAQAEALYLEILSQEPDHFAALDLLGILYAQEGRFVEAIDCFEAALKIDPNSANCHNHLANCLKSSGDFPAAMTHFQTALKLQPNYPEAYNNLGTANYLQKEYDLAIDCFLKAIELKEDYADAYTNLALAYLARRDLHGAKLALEDVLQRGIDNSFALFHLANIAYEQEQLTHAIALFQQLLEIHPRNPEAHINLGAAYLHNKQQELGIEHFQQALRIDPQNVTALTNLGAYFLSQQQIAEAKGHYLKALSLANTNPIIHFNLGVILMGERNWESALVHLKEALNFAAEDTPGIHQNLAIVYLKLQDKEAALHHYQQALSLQPDNVQIQYVVDALSGKQTLERAPTDYVVTLFDRYAEDFDAELIEKLDYKVPQLLEELLTPYLEGKPPVTLDLGCGTGLAGERLRPQLKCLIGVDLSPKMIARCAEKGCYDELHCGEMIEVMTQLQGSVDLIIAADALEYLGDLTSFFTHCSAILTSTGLIAFSIEETSVTDYFLQESGRFAHHQDYIERLAVNSGLKVLQNQQVTLRTQFDKPVHGRIFLLQKL